MSVIKDDEIERNTQVTKTIGNNGKARTKCWLQVRTVTRGALPSAAPLQRVECNPRRESETVGTVHMGLLGKAAGRPWHSTLAGRSKHGHQFLLGSN